LRGLQFIDFRVASHQSGLQLLYLFFYFGVGEGRQLLDQIVFQVFLQLCIAIQYVPYVLRRVEHLFDTLGVLVERHEAETENAVHLLCVVIGVLQSVGHRVDQVLKLLLALFVETRVVLPDDLLIIFSSELLEVGAA